MDIYLILYCIYAILIGIFGTAYLFRSKRTTSAILFLIGALFIFIFFGNRWFGQGGDIFHQTPGSWPPYINTCPDYLTYYKRVKSNGESSDTCIDRIGVSKNSSLQVFPSDSTNANPDNDAYFFPLATQSSDPSQKRLELCNRTLQYGLTWEGICDGESCLNPIPSSGGNSGGDNGGASGTTPGCPAPSGSQ
jgi:hypothetical protein